MPLSNASLQIVAGQAVRLPSALARLYSNYALRSNGRPGMAHWTDAEALEREADAYRLAALGFSLLDEGELNLAATTLRRAAEILEWLFVDRKNDDMALLSILLYQIAGFPAVARSLSSIYPQEDLISLIARGDFTSCEKAIASFCRALGNDPLTSRGASDSDGADVFQEAFVSAAALLVAHMRWGEPRISDGIQALEDVARYFMLASDPLSWLLARAFATMARRAAENSIRSVCTPLVAQLSPNGRVALERYVRELHSDRRSIAWPSQILGVNALIEGRDFAMCTPTGSGKTTVAELAIIQSLFSGSHDFFAESAVGRLVMYIVPSRALAREVEIRLRRAFAHNESFPVQVVSSYGGADVSPLENWLSSQRGTVIVCTQEKADALIRASGPLFLNRLKLMIIDEAHSIQATEDDYERPLRLESLIARLRNLSVGTECRVIALSAVLEDATALTRWIDSNAEQAVYTEYRSTRQAFGRLTMTSSGELNVQYDMLNGTLLGTENSPEFRPNLRNFVPHFSHIQERATDGPEVQLRALALWVAANLAALDRPDSGLVLITVGTQINHFAKDFIGLLSHWSDIPTFFDLESAFQQTAYLDALESCKDYFGEQSYEYNLLQRGIVVHHGKLPLQMARAFTKLIELRVTRVVVATSTLSEGVNLPFETILFPSLRGPKGDMTAEYIRNVVGRAGRPGVAREGRALVLIGTGRKFRVAVQRYRAVVDKLSGALVAETPTSGIQILLRQLYAGWRELTGGTSLTDFCDWLELTRIDTYSSSEFAAKMDSLDQFIISGIAELEAIDGHPATSADTESRLQQLWTHTFCHAVNAQSPAQRPFMARARRIHKEYTSTEEVRQSYRTSLGPRSAAALFAQIDDMRALFNRGYAYVGWDPEKRFTYIVDVLSTVLAVPDFNFTKSFRAGDPKWQVLLSWWLGHSHDYPTAAKVGRWYSLANESFAYRGAWGIGSAMLSMLNENSITELPLSERLHDNGVPWLALWLRDMLTLGCLDPVQAAVFSRGAARSRPEALALSAQYYTQVGALEDEVLEPTRIMSWLQDLYPGATPSRTEGTAIVYSLHSVAEGLQNNVFRVWPESRRDDVIWRDVSGYPIATSIGSSQTDIAWDYVADIQHRTVTVTLYL